MAKLRSGLVEEYVLDLCSPEERRLVEDQIKQDPELASMIREMKSSLHKYCQDHRSPPPVELKSSLQAKIKELKSSDQRQALPEEKALIRKLRRHRMAAVAACTLLLLAVGILVNHNVELTNAYAQLDQEYDRAVTDRQLLAKEIDDMGGRFQLVSDLSTSHVHLAGTRNAPQAIGVVYWNEARQEAMFRIVNLPSPPPGMSYQMWADVDGEMKDLGVLQNGSGTWLELPFIENAESLNLTLEEGSGSKHPNTDQIVISGKI
ncbi:MAG: anti-sigma factor [Saprospiraceae bacterium]|nr:anti-sigma factor [Saprospiraceae bacterium]